MRLQFSASGGSLGTTWIDCNESKGARLIQDAANFHGHSIDQIKAGLLGGFIVAIGNEWNAAKLRDHDSVKSVKLEKEITENAINILSENNEPEFI